MLEVTPSIDRFSVTVTHNISTAGSYDENGNWVEGTQISRPISATLQPISGRHLHDMPEGIRAEACWMIWTRHGLELDQQIEHDGKIYRVLHLCKREIGGYTRAALGLMHD